MSATIGPWKVTLVSASESTNAKGLAGHLWVIQLQVENKSNAAEKLANGSSVMVQGRIRASDGKLYPESGPEPVALSDGTNTGNYKVRMTLPPGFAEPLALAIATPDQLAGGVLVLDAPDCDSCGGDFETPLSAIPAGTAKGAFSAPAGSSLGTRFDWGPVRVNLDKVAWAKARTGECAPLTAMLTFANGSGEEFVPTGSVEVLDAAGHADWYYVNVAQEAVRPGATRAFALGAPADGATLGTACGTPGPHSLVVVLDALTSAGGTSIAGATTYVYAFRG